MGLRREKDHSISVEDGASNVNINETYRHIVRVGDKYAKRDFEENMPRFTLTESEYKFTSTVMAREAVSYFASVGKRATLEHSY